MLVRGRDERPAHRPLRLLGRAIEGGEVPEDYRGRGNRPFPLLPPPPLLLPALLAREAAQLRPAQHPSEAFIPFQYPQVVHTIPAGQVHEHQRHHNLRVGPPLGPPSATTRPIGTTTHRNGETTDQSQTNGESSAPATSPIT